MKNLKHALKAATTIALLNTSVQAYASDVYTAYSGSQTGITIRNSDTLAQSGYIATNAPINGVTGGSNNNLYVTSGNSISNYSTNGTLINSFSWYDNTITYGDISQKNGNLFSAYSGSQSGVTIRNANSLTQTSYIATNFNINGLAAGNNNNVYLTSGNTIYNYGINGSLINSFSWHDNTINYRDIAVGSNSIFTVYSGSQNGVTIRDQNTLAQTGLIIPGFDITGITVGFNNDVFLTSGNTIYNYSNTGVFLKSFAWYDNTINYGSLSTGVLSSNNISSVPVPGSVWLFASGLLGVIGFRRQTA